MTKMAFAISLFLFLQSFFSMEIADESHLSHLNPLVTQTGDQSWNALLRKYVDSDGNVNYLGFKEDRAQLSEYLAYLAIHSPGANATREEKLVYYINLYNAATVLLIVENYPVGSIKDIKNPWDNKWINVGGKILSLGDIEHKILRKLEEPRIHFAINCASYSCPKLLNEAYSDGNLEILLEKATIEFINDPERNRINEDVAEISKIFQWYRSDFTTHGSLADYLNNYSKVQISADTKIRYIKYNWGLNESKRK